MFVDLINLIDLNKWSLYCLIDRLPTGRPNHSIYCLPQRFCYHSSCPRPARLESQATCLELAGRDACVPNSVISKLSCRSQQVPLTNDVPGRAVGTQGTDKIWFLWPRSLEGGEGRSVSLAVRREFRGAAGVQTAWRRG